MFNVNRSRLWVVLILCVLMGPCYAQSVAFTGKDSNSPDEFAFVALQDLAIGTKIFFTENDFDNSGGAPGLFASGEGTILFEVVGGVISTGTVVHIAEDTTPDTFVLMNAGSSTAVIVGASSWSATAADPHYAYSASNDASPWSTVTEVHAMLFPLESITAFGSRDPSGLYPNAIVVDNSTFASTQTAADYTGDRSTATHMSLADSNNFTAGDGDLDLTAFTSVPVELMSFAVD